MFKKKEPPFFLRNDEPQEERSSKEATSWRKGISPLPSFLLKAQEDGRKDGFLKMDKDSKESQRSSKYQEKEAKNLSPRLYLSQEEKEIFRAPHSSLFSQKNSKERYVFTMTKLSFWTVLLSLFFLGALFFVGGFMLALYLVNGSSFQALQHDQKIFGKEVSISSKLEEKVSSVEKSLEEKKIPFLAESHPSSPSQEKTNPSSQAAVPSSPPASLPHPSSQGEAFQSVSQSSKEGKEITSSRHALGPSAASPLKQSPLILQKKSSLEGGGMEKVLSRYSIEYGVFTTREEALSLVNSLAISGFHPVVVRIKGPLQILSFSVRCGNFQTQESASGAWAEAKKLYKNSALVLNDPFATVVYP